MQSETMPTSSAARRRRSASVASSRAFAMLVTIAFSARYLASMWVSASSMRSGTVASQSTERTSRRVASSWLRNISAYCTVRYRACSAASRASPSRPPCDQVLQLHLGGDLGRLHIGVQGADQHVDRLVGGKEIDVAVRAGQFDQQLEVEVPAHVAPVFTQRAVHRAETPIQAPHVEQVLQDPVSHPGVLGVGPARALCGDEPDKTANDLLLACAAVEVHRDGDLVDGLQPDLRHLVVGPVDPVQPRLAGIQLAIQMAEKTTTYLLDEPTSGLHLADVDQLLALLDRLVDDGNTVIVIEHHQAVMAHADWLIDLGGAGQDGGRVVFTGTPADLIAHGDSLTAQHLRTYLADAP